MSEPAAYPPTIVELLREPRLMPLGAGQPNESVRPTLAKLDIATVFGDRPVRDGDAARACLAGLWLYHDFIGEAHTISQEIHTATGSFWHAVMHRREGDFDNAKYWFRRVGNHPIFIPLYVRVQEQASSTAIESGPATDFILMASWDPFSFVDLVEAVVKKQSRSEMFCRQAQQAEWQLLFAFSYQLAIGEAKWN